MKGNTEAATMTYSEVQQHLADVQKNGKILEEKIQKLEDDKAKMEHLSAGMCVVGMVLCILTLMLQFTMAKGGF